MGWIEHFGYHPSRRCRRNTLNLRTREQMGKCAGCRRVFMSSEVNMAACGWKDLCAK
uniref:Uncharacterized protein n=1 Tax=Oryza brachyantha TaxID=4533 RepID=J3LHA5_ORYBR